jgi:hypothetical protein
MEVIIMKDEKLTSRERDTLRRIRDVKRNKRAGFVSGVGGYN